MPNESIIAADKHGSGKPFLNVSCEPETQVIKSTGQLQWKQLGTQYGPQNVSGKRWGSGVLISNKHFLTAGHCFEASSGQYGAWTPFYPSKPGQMNSFEFANLMQVNFNFQHQQCDGTDVYGPIFAEDSYSVVRLIEFKINGLDFAIAELDGNPGEKYGFVNISLEQLTPGQQIYIAQHPDGQPKKIDSGIFYGYSGTKSEVMLYDPNTQPGSSGSAVTPDHISTAGVHIQGEGTYAGMNVGVSLRAIYRYSGFIQTVCFPAPDYSLSITIGVISGLVAGGVISHKLIKSEKQRDKISAQVLITGSFGVFGGVAAYKIQESIYTKQISDKVQEIARQDNQFLPALNHH